MSILDRVTEWSFRNADYIIAVAGVWAGFGVGTVMNGVLAGVLTAIITGVISFWMASARAPTLYQHQ